MADDFYSSLGETGDLAQSLLARAGERRSKTRRGERRARNVALLGSLMGIADKYLAKNAISAYQKFEESLLPEKEFFINNFENRQNFINEDRILQSFKDQVLDNEVKEKQRREMMLGVPSGMSTLSTDYTNYLNGRAEEEAKEFLSKGGRYQWDKRTQADYLAPYTQTIRQAKIDMMSPRNTSVVRKFFGLFGDKNAQQDYEKKRDTLLDNHNRFRQKADYIQDYDNEFDEVTDTDRYKYSPNQTTITELAKAYRNGEANTQATSEAEFIDEVTKKYQDYISAHGINKSTLQAGNAYIFTSSVLDQDEINRLQDVKKAKERLADISDYDPNISINEQSVEIQQLYERELQEFRRKRLGAERTAEEKLEVILDEVETFTAQIQAGKLTSEQASAMSPAYRNSIAYTPPEIFKSYRNTAIDEVSKYSVERLNEELVSINANLGFDDESAFKLNTATDLTNYQALLKTVLYFDSLYENNPEEFNKALNSLGPIMSETTQEELLEALQQRSDEGVSIINPNI